MKKSRENIKKSLIIFLKNGNPEFSKNKNYLDDKSLIEMGYIDSFGIIDIVTYIEKKWKVKIKDNEISKETFGSINKIADFIFFKVK
jgi:acyl carrier protein